MASVAFGGGQRFATVDLRPSPQTGWRAIAIGGAVVLVMLVDGTAANAVTAALPYLQALSAATPDEESWILIAFNAAYYSTILLSPWLYARFGRKPLLLAGLLGFGVTSLLLVAVQPLEEVVALRFVQGMFLGSVFVPAAALLFTSLPLKLLPLAPPFFATIVLGSGTMGSFIGGYVSETYGGAAVYLPGAVIALSCAALLYVAAPNVEAPQRSLRPDVVGFVLALVSFGALVYLANDGERRNWFDDGSSGIAAGALALGAGLLVLWELYLTATPLLNLRLLARTRNLSVGSVANILLGMAGYSVVTFVLYLETVAGATATLAGAMILLRLVTYVVGITIGFLLLKRRIVGVRTLVAAAAVGSALAYWSFAQHMTTGADAASFVVISLLLGLCFSMLSQAVPTLVLGSLALPDLPVGLSLYKVSAPIGISIGTALLQTLQDHRSAVHLSALAGAVTYARDPIAHYLAGGGTIGALAALASGQAQVLAFDDVMLAFGLCVLLTVPVIFAAKLRADPPG